MIVANVAKMLKDYLKDNGIKPEELRKELNISEASFRRLMDENRPIDYRRVKLYSMTSKIFHKAIVVNEKVAEEALKTSPVLGKVALLGLDPTSPVFTSKEVKSIVLQTMKKYDEIMNKKLHVVPSGER
jgi:hypothetical protein